MTSADILAAYDRIGAHWAEIVREWDRLPEAPPRIYASQAGANLLHVFGDAIAVRCEQWRQQVLLDGALPPTSEATDRFAAIGLPSRAPEVCG